MITLLYLWITEALTVKGNTLIFIIIILGGLAILLGIWIKGREELKINRKRIGQNENKGYEVIE